MIIVHAWFRARVPKPHDDSNDENEDVAFMEALVLAHQEHTSGPPAEGAAYTDPDRDRADEITQLYPGSLARN